MPRVLVLTWGTERDPLPAMVGEPAGLPSRPAESTGAGRVEAA